MNPDEKKNILEALIYKMYSMPFSRYLFTFLPRLRLHKNKLRPLSSFFGTTKKIDRLLYKLSNKHSNEKLFFIKVVSISRFHYKSFIKSLIFKIFFLVGLPCVYITQLPVFLSMSNR